MLALVREKQLQIKNNTQPVRGTVGETLELRFSEDWEGLSVTAVFSAGSVRKDVAVEGDALTIPWELYAEAGHTLWLNFHGARADGSLVLRTPRVSLGCVQASDDPSGSEPEAPSPTRADQIQALAEQALAAAQALRADAENGAFDGADGEDGSDGFSPTVSVAAISGGHRVTVTDANGAASFDVADGVSPAVDAALSADSENAVQNKAVKAALALAEELALGAYPTAEASGALAAFEDGAGDVPVGSLTVRIEPVQSGNGDPAPDNLRPIAGRTGAKVTRTGKNVVHIPDQAVQGSDAIRNALIPVISALRFKENTQYTFSCTVHTEDASQYWGLQFLYTDGSSEYKWLHKPAENLPSVTSAANKTIADILFAYSTVLQIGFSDAQLETGAAATAFEACESASAQISWQSEAGTVYGGTLDLTAGLLTVDRVCIDLGEREWRYETAVHPGWPYFYTEIADKKPGWNNGMCSAYKLTAAQYTRTEDRVFSCVPYYNAKNLIIRDSGFTDAAAFKAALDGVQFVYELAEPVVYRLAPGTLRTLRGTNRIWADAGEAALRYRADPTLYAERRLRGALSAIAGVESGFTATRNYAAGSLLIVGGTLYKTTAAVANGAAITPGSNAAATTVAEQLGLLANT